MNLSPENKPGNAHPRKATEQAVERMDGFVGALKDADRDTLANKKKKGRGFGKLPAAKWVDYQGSKFLIITGWVGAKGYSREDWRKTL